MIKLLKSINWEIVFIWLVAFMFTGFAWYGIVQLALLIFSN